MKPEQMIRNGFSMRTMRCEKCNERVVHPLDLQEYKQFTTLRNKTFRVKLRLVGNSYAVSIPKEIVDFMHEQEKIMDDMVRLCFEDARRLSLMFREDEKENIEEVEEER